MKQTNFPVGMYTSNMVRAPPYFYQEVISPQTNFEFDMNRVDREPSSRIPGRWNWRTGFPNGYGTGNFQFQLNCSPYCIAKLEDNPKGYASEKTLAINKYYQSLPFYVYK